MINKIYSKSIIRYTLSFMTAVSSYWLLYYIISWSLYGLATITNNGTVMNWLALTNHFEPAQGSRLYQYHHEVSIISSQDDAKEPYDVDSGISYLNNNRVWVKEEMDSIMCLQGLFDELMYYDIDKINQRDNIINESPQLIEIIELIKEIKKGNYETPKVYSYQEDNRITPKIYINRLRRIKEKYELSKHNSLDRWE